MSLTADFRAFGQDNDGDRQACQLRAKRPAPFSIRLNEEERARLVREAGGTPLGTYIKAKALGEPALRSRRTGIAVEDRAALAKGLALLGRSRIASTLDQLAYAASIGALPLNDETERELRETLRAVRDLRRLFLMALGMKPGDAP